MAIQFPDLNPGGPSATSNSKTAQRKVAQLLAADFTTGGTASVKLVLPADSTIISISYWKKTQFSGNSVSAVTLSIGIPGTPTQFANAFDVFTPAAGVSAAVSPLTNIMQNAQLPLPSDIVMLFTGTATTGNPTAGEMYISVVYAR